MAKIRTVTMYQLRNVEPTLDGMFLALPSELLDELRLTPLFPDFPDAEAYLLRGHFELPKVGWSDDLSQLVDDDLPLDDKKAAGLLLVAVEGNVFAIGFGQGYRLVPDELKDPDFGLRVASRAVDPERVHDVVRKSMIRQGRQDTTYDSLGLPIGSLGVRRHAELVRKLGGELKAEHLGLDGDRSVTIQGSAGLRLPIPLDKRKLVALLKRIIKICEADIHPDFAFIEAIKQVQDDAIVSLLEASLDRALLGEVAAPVTLSVPVDLVPRLAETQTFNFKIGSVYRRGRPDLVMAEVISRCKVLNGVAPSQALREGRIELSDRRDGMGAIGGAPAIKWLEADFTLGERHYFLLDGTWRMVCEDYLAGVREQVSRLINPNPSTRLPRWKKGEHERAYNIRVQHELGRASHLCLDRALVKTDLHQRSGFEACDLYGPDGELICVKPAGRSAPLGHAFNQALVAVEALISEQGAMERFAEVVAEASGGTRTVPDGYRPRKVIFAIHLAGGRTVTDGTLFPFAQVALVNMATVLKSVYAVDVEVIGIPAE